MKEGRSGISIRAEQATRELRTAEKLERRRAFDRTDARFKAIEAQRARDEGERLLAAPDRLVGDAGTEIVPAPVGESNVPNLRLHYLDTLADPNTTNVDASEHRAAVATRVGVLSAALDAAQSAKANNSLEKMLCHQLAAVHLTGMELLTRFGELSGLRSMPPCEIARLAIAAARLFEVYQSGCLTLQKLKTRGRQYVVVQHQQVNVASGGQAIVAGDLRDRGASRRAGDLSQL
jgi:hypothetical protein